MFSKDVEDKIKSTLSEWSTAGYNLAQLANNMKHAVYELTTYGQHKEYLRSLTDTQKAKRDAAKAEEAYWQEMKKNLSKI